MMLLPRKQPVRRGIVRRNRATNVTRKAHAPPRVEARL